MGHFLCGSVSDPLSALVMGFFKGGGVEQLNPLPTYIKAYPWDSHKTDEKLFGTTKNTCILSY